MTFNGNLPVSSCIRSLFSGIREICLVETLSIITDVNMGMNTSAQKGVPPLIFIKSVKRIGAGMEMIRPSQSEWSHL